MITKPLEYPNMSEPIDLTCSYYLKSIGVGRPNVFWTYNDRLPAGKHFEKLIPKSTGVSELWFNFCNHFFPHLEMRRAINNIFSSGS